MNCPQAEEQNKQILENINCFGLLLFVIIVFANDFNIVSNQIYRVKPDSKLANEI